MSVFEISLIFAALLSSMVTGFLFAYAVVIMPGIKQFDDVTFLKTFQVTDKIIQNNHPLFMAMWVGSVIALLLSLILGFFELSGFNLVLLIAVSVVYMVGVQVRTVRNHLPLNTHVVKLNLEQMTEEELRAERIAFEEPWNRSNEIRTAISFCVSLILIVLVLRL